MSRPTISQLFSGILHSRASLIVLYCTMSHITFRQQVHPCPVRHAASLQSAFRPLITSSTTCSSWESSAHLRVVGHPPCIWPRRKRQVIDGPAVTTVHLTTALSPTVVPFLVYKISWPPSTEPRSSVNLIWWGCTTKFRLNLRISLRPLW